MAALRSRGYLRCTTMCETSEDLGRDCRYGDFKASLFIAENYRHRRVGLDGKQG